MFKFLKEKLGNWAKKASELGKEAVSSKKSEEQKPEKKQKIKKERKSSKKEESKKIEVKEERKIIVPPAEKGFFERIQERISKTKITEEDFNKNSEELEMLLLENNVALEVAEKIISSLKQNLVGKELPKKDIENEIKNSLSEAISSIILEPFSIIDEIRKKENKPYVILFCGINGSGKTTTIAKLAHLLKKKGISSVIAAGDTFRAASIEQLNEHEKKLGIKVISNAYGSDPASVGFDAIQYAKKNRVDCVLIDTAGRMHTAKNLLAEIEKISKVCNPDLKVFVGESITGNDSVEQVKAFDSALGLSGIILTKSDIDEKGGTAISLGYITKKPIFFLGTGQNYDDFEPFNKEKFLEKLGL